MSRELAAAALTLCCAVGCAPEFEKVSEVRSLRVLGVQKSAPYARPGETVELSVLWHDGRAPEARRPVTVSWLPGCVNPRGDLYSGCFEQFAELSGSAGGAPPTGPLPLPRGDRFRYTLPPDVIERHPEPESGPRYGLAVVFFAVCSGELRLVQRSDGLPLGCFDGDRELLSDDFVAGYSMLYSYESLTNRNPTTTGFRFNGRLADTACADLDCLGPDPEPPACGDDDTPCIDACAADGDPEKCPAWPIEPVLDPSIVDDDPLIPGLTEQIWVAYYVERGGVKSELRLVNDAAAGWNPTFGTSYYAPRESGWWYLWAVVRDNRGGASWTRMRVFVR